MKIYWKADDGTHEAEVPDGAVHMATYADCPRCKSKGAIRSVRRSEGVFDCTVCGEHPIPPLAYSIRDASVVLYAPRVTHKPSEDRYKVTDDTMRALAGIVQAAQNELMNMSGKAPLRAIVLDSEFALRAGLMPGERMEIGGVHVCSEPRGFGVVDGTFKMPPESRRIGKIETSKP